MPLFWNNNFNQRVNFNQGNFNRQVNFQNNQQINGNGSLFSRFFLNRQNQNISNYNQQQNQNIPMQNILNYNQQQNQTMPIQNIPNCNQQQNQNMPMQNISNYNQQQNQNIPIQNIPNYNQQQENSGISFKPLTEEDFVKINEEIKENIEKNQKQIFPINEPKDKESLLNSLKEFIQDETNGNIFYNSLANNCNNEYYKDRLNLISEDCNFEKKCLKKYYKNLQNEDFEPENLQININMPLKQGLILAIEEEIKSYDKICNILDKLPYEDTREFYKMALKKLSRINSIQYMVMDKNI